MFCPECKVEYRPGFTQCADCRVALVDSLPAQPQETPVDVELVIVLKSTSAMEFQLATYLLEEAGIPFFVEHEYLAVPRDRETEARTIVESMAVEEFELPEDFDPEQRS